MTFMKPCRGGCGKPVDEDAVVCDRPDCYQKMMDLMASVLVTRPISKHPAFRWAAKKYNKKQDVKPGARLLLFQRRVA